MADTKTPRTDGLLATFGSEPQDSEDARNYQADKCIALTHMSKRLETQLSEALRKLRERDVDAERYRWLRSQCWTESSLSVVANPKEATKPGSHLPSLERLDDMIDAALVAADQNAGAQDDSDASGSRCAALTCTESVGQQNPVSASAGADSTTASLSAAPAGTTPETDAAPDAAPTPENDLNKFGTARDVNKYLTELEEANMVCSGLLLKAESRVAELEERLARAVESAVSAIASWDTQITALKDALAKEPK